MSVSDDNRVNGSVDVAVGEKDDVALVAEGTEVRVAVLRIELDTVWLVSVRGDEDGPRLALGLVSVKGED